MAVKHHKVGRANFLHGDVIEALRGIKTNTFHAGLTDPPYGIDIGSGAGEKWDAGEAENIAFQTELWAEVLRVMRPGAFIMAFNAARQEHRLSGAMEAAGFRIRDRLLWLYSSSQARYQDAQKLVVTEQELEGIEAADFQYKVKEWKGWRVAFRPNYEPIVLAQKPLGDGLNVGQNLLRWGCGALNIDACRVPSPDGTLKYPGNVITDEMIGEASRYFYSPKASKTDAGGSSHLTVKPISLLQYLIKGVAPRRARILDCFGGSGTMAQAALDLDVDGYRLVPTLIERDARYAADIRARLTKLRKEHGTMKNGDQLEYTANRPIAVEPQQSESGGPARRAAAGQPVPELKRGSRIPWAGA